MDYKYIHPLCKSTGYTLKFEKITNSAYRSIDNLEQHESSFVMDAERYLVPFNYPARACVSRELSDQG